MIGLTHKQAECLKVIQDLTVDGVPPSYDEIRMAMGLASKNAVHRLVGELEGRGSIRRLRCRARSIEVLVPRPKAPRLPTMNDLLALSVEDLRQHLNLVAGVIAAKSALGVEREIVSGAA